MGILNGPNCAYTEPDAVHLSAAAAGEVTPAICQHPGLLTFAPSFLQKTHTCKLAMPSQQHRMQERLTCNQASDPDKGCWQVQEATLLTLTFHFQFDMAQAGVLKALALFRRWLSKPQSKVAVQCQNQHKFLQNALPCPTWMHGKIV